MLFLLVLREKNQYALFGKDKRMQARGASNAPIYFFDSARYNDFSSQNDGEFPNEAFRGRGAGIVSTVDTYGNENANFHHPFFRGTTVHLA